MFKIPQVWKAFNYEYFCKKNNKRLRQRTSVERCEREVNKKKKNIIIILQYLKSFWLSKILR